MEVTEKSMVIVAFLEEDTASDPMQDKVPTLPEKHIENAASVNRKKSSRRSPDTSHRLNECLRHLHDGSTAYETAF